VDWIKKHSDAVMVLSAIVSSMLWMNGKFTAIDSQFSNVEKELAVIKAVMVMRNIMPPELVKQVDN
jgi:hypothetical protein